MSWVAELEQTADDNKLARIENARLQLVRVLLGRFIDGAEKFPLFRGAPDYRGICLAATGVVGRKVGPGSTIRKEIDLAWARVRLQQPEAVDARSAVVAGADVVSALGLADVNISTQEYAVQNFDVARFYAAMHRIREALSDCRAAEKPTSLAPAAWWTAFEDWRAVENESGFMSWLRRLCGTPSHAGSSKTAAMMTVLGLLRRERLMLCPAGLLTGATPHPCSSWYDGMNMPLSETALTEWERSFFLPAPPNNSAMIRALLTMSPMVKAAEFPAGSFITSMAASVAHEPVHVAGRDLTIAVTLKIARLLDHHVALVSTPVMSRGNSDDGDPAQVSEGPWVSMEETFDRLLRDRGLRGHRPSDGEALDFLRSGPAGKWADLMSRYVAAQSWRAPSARLKVARVLVEGLAAMPVVPKIADADLRRRLVTDPDCFFARWDESTDTSAFIAAEAMSLLRHALDWHSRSHPTFRNPILASDVPPQPRPRKSLKVLLPRDIIEEAKAVCRELLDAVRSDSGELPDTILNRRLKKAMTVRLAVPGVGTVDRLNPVLPTAISTLLTIPIRGIQARLLDSGEADEFVPVLRPGTGRVSERIDWIVNPHPLALSRRREGAVRRIRDTTVNTEFVGFWINTNKASDDGTGADSGYEIPWQQEQVIEDLLFLVDEI